MGTRPWGLPAGSALDWLVTDAPGMSTAGSRVRAHPLPGTQACGALQGLLRPLPGGGLHLLASHGRDHSIGSGADPDRTPLESPSFAGQPADLLDELGTLGHLDPLGECLDVVVLLHRDGDLGEDRPGVDAGVDEEECGPGDLDAVLESVARTGHTGEGGQQRVVGVDVATLEPFEEPWAAQLEEPGGDD